MLRIIPAASNVMKDAYWPAVGDHVADELATVVATKKARHAGESADAGEAEQRGELEEAERRDRTEEIEPAALVDEVLTAWVGA